MGKRAPLSTPHQGRLGGPLLQLRALIADGTIGRPNFEPTSYHAKWNREQRLFALALMEFAEGNLFFCASFHRTPEQTQARGYATTSAVMTSARI
jgi:predicted dehydrogenase